MECNIMLRDTFGHLLMAHVLLGTEEWDGQMGIQYCVEGHHGTSLDVSWCPLGTEG